MNKLIYFLMFCAFNLFASDASQLVGKWNFDLAATQKTKEYKALKEAPSHLGFFKGVSTEFTAEGKLIQSKNGKVMMSMNYKVVAQKASALHVEIIKPENGKVVDQQVCEINDAGLLVLHLAKKDFTKIMAPGDVPLVMSKDNQSK
ncbi:hypothetical protein LNTAR_23019 [Lentisphaera araneosa HTCC2155]|jgi:hypothetical protein|uniref:Lipocalin-like domain-containing protein n=1 Tax=Lentisphaera araneosa HTCC2155 TaxID=313628 RepID=A6DGJ5_9BACT|nr:hypothetical protein [Lentisphaera araneosa]EDM29312.1 hypothetical protein LNTAR_23019 [Lentisphaera araneosa HTCC2155]